MKTIRKIFGELAAVFRYMRADYDQRQLDPAPAFDPVATFDPAEPFTVIARAPAVQLPIDPELFWCPPPASGNRGLLIWRVRYRGRFVGQAGGIPYHIDHERCTGLVLTRAESFEAVRQELEKSLDAQTHLLELQVAELLGCVLNSKLP